MPRKDHNLIELKKLEVHTLTTLSRNKISPGLRPSNDVLRTRTFERNSIKADKRYDPEKGIEGKKRSKPCFTFRDYFVHGFKVSQIYIVIYHFVGC